MTNDDIAFADVATLQRLLTRRELSSLELTNLYLSRLEKYGPSYGALVTLLPERARTEAKRADRERAAGRVRGPLHGIPYGVKDLLAARGAPTTWGAAPYRTQRLDYDATVVRKLNAAGAVLLAKLAMVELAGGFGYNDADASFTGPGRTPWNRDFWSGGSSSGSGAAVAAGLVGFAIGSETSGSILFPSTACGITGLRPTYGRVSRHGAMALCWTLDKLGPMARSAADVETILRTIAGADPNDPTAVDRPFPTLRRRPRIGVLAGATKRTMPEVKANFEASLAVLREFCDVVGEVALPKLPYSAAVQTIVNAEGAAAFRDLIESGRSRELRQKDDRTGGYSGYAMLAVDYIDALRQRKFMIEAFKQTFGAYDAIVAPTLRTVTLPVGVPFDKAYPKYRGPGAVSLIAPANLVGVPAIGIPNGFGPNGLPTGLSFVGSAFAETTLTGIARRYQMRTQHHRKVPTLLVTLALGAVLGVALPAYGQSKFSDLICPNATEPVREVQLERRAQPPAPERLIAAAKKAIAAYDRCASQKLVEGEATAGTPDRQIRYSTDSGAERQHYANLRAAEYHLTIGWLHRLLGEYDLARSSYQTALALVKDTIEWQSSSSISYSSNDVNIGMGSLRKPSTNPSFYRRDALALRDSILAELHRLPPPAGASATAGERQR